MDLVDRVLIERRRDPHGMRLMISTSLALHVAAAVAIVAAPVRFSSRPVLDESRAMVISLGGAPGPRTGGFTPASARPIQQMAPPAAKPEPVAPPAKKTPEMTAPNPKDRVVKPMAPVRRAAAEARGKRVATGPELRQGTAVAETGATGLGFGLSTGGGGGTGGSLDIGSFPYPEYLRTLLDLINRNWDHSQPIQFPQRTVIKFTILRDGSIVRQEIEHSSGSSLLDIAALRAVTITRRLPPLPQGFPEDHLTVHLWFDYTPGT